jgi:hypothetical protein
MRPRFPSDSATLLTLGEDAAEIATAGAVDER